MSVRIIISSARYILLAVFAIMYGFVVVSMLRLDTRVRCMLCNVVPVLHLTNVATETTHVYCKLNNRHKVAFDKYNSATTSIEPFF